MKKMFFLLSFVVLTAFQATAQNDAISRFFNKYQDDERFTSVYISPKMFQMIAKIDADDADWQKMRDVVKDLGGLRVLTADSIPDGDGLYRDALSKVPVKEYEELLTVRDGKENVRIWVKESNNVIEELLLLVGAPTEFTLVSFVGKLDLDKISSISKSIDIDGVKHLDKIKSEEKKD